IAGLVSSRPWQTGKRSMVSRSQIDSLSRKVDALVLALKPADQLPPCPLIRLAINGGGNTHAEQAAITAYIERSQMRRERVTFEVDLEFTDGLRDGNGSDTEAKPS